MQPLAAVRDLVAERFEFGDPLRRVTDPLVPKLESMDAAAAGGLEGLENPVALGLPHGPAPILSQTAQSSPLHEDKLTEHMIVWEATDQADHFLHDAAL
jgi:hypothetical protein